MTVVIEGASIVREYQGAYVNVLVYKQRCDACGYLAPKNSLAVSMVPYDAYETEGFFCPCCTNYQAVKIRLELGEAAGLQEDISRRFTDGGKPAP